MKQRFSKYSCVFSFMLVIIYALFFSVELLYNFDTNITVIFAGKSPSHHPVIKCNKSGDQVTLNFRLNKRFQPSFIPAGPSFPAAGVIEHNDRNYEGSYSSESILNIFLLTQSLRAPPVV
jgi:hypothetical protein